jgi:uncharacterized protein DUF6130
MRNTFFRATSYSLILGVLMFGFSVLVSGQYSSNTQSGTMAKGTPTMTATLVDPEKKAQQKAATVSVKVTGIKLIDPATVNEQPKMGQGHLHYQVDDGPVIATPTTKLSFHGLTPGQHKILVVLAGNDHNPLGPQQTLEVTIP